MYHVVKQLFVYSVYNGFFLFLLLCCSLVTLPLPSANFIKSLSRILLLKLKSVSIRHMINGFYVRNPSRFFYRIVFVGFSNILVHILLCRGYVIGRIQNLKGRATVNMRLGVQSAGLIFRMRYVLSSLNIPPGIFL